MRRPTRPELSRRGLLFGGLAVAGAAALGGCGPLLTPRGSIVPLVGKVHPSAVPLPGPYEQELPRPAAVRPISEGHHRLTQRVATAEILPGRTTEVWGYDGTFPGPLLEARRGRPFTLTVRNELPTPTSTHLHGGVTPLESDGLPLDLVVPEGFDVANLDRAMANGHGSHGEQEGGSSPSGHGGQGHGGHGHGGHGGHGGESGHGVSSIWTLHDRERDHRYPMTQQAATLWYHDHRMDFSAPQVWRGLAGICLVRDDEEDALELPAGPYEIPMLLTDRSFGADAELSYPGLDQTLTVQPGVRPEFADGVLGDVMLVNGAPSPYAPVPATRHRLRLVNGCNARALRLALHGPGGSLVEMQQIGTDIGLLPAPVSRTRVDLHPGERVDLVVDLGAFEVGTELELLNEFVPVGAAERTREVVKFVIDRPGPASAPVPSTLVEHPLLDGGEVVATRQFDFRMGVSGVWGINGHGFDPAGSVADVRAGTVERWIFTSDFNHPVHLHTAHFQVQSVNGRGVEQAERGWKDTVNVTPYGHVEVLVRFPDHIRGTSMLHCHNLEHEDMAMMANYTIG
ncbi:multicopper oxidase family protein [Propionibacteriaceae bacterium Y2011]